MRFWKLIHMLAVRVHINALNSKCLFYPRILHKINRAPSSLIILIQWKSDQKLKEIGPSNCCICWGFIRWLSHNEQWLICHFPKEGKKYMNPYFFTTDPGERFVHQETKKGNRKIQNVQWKEIVNEREAIVMMDNLFLEGNFTFQSDLLLLCTVILTMDYFPSIYVHPSKSLYGHMDETHGFVSYQVCECWTTGMFLDFIQTLCQK